MANHKNLPVEGTRLPSRRRPGPNQIDQQSPKQILIICQCNDLDLDWQDPKGGLQGGVFLEGGLVFRSCLFSNSFLFIGKPIHVNSIDMDQ